MFRYLLLLAVLLVCYSECAARRPPKCRWGYKLRPRTRSCYRVFLRPSTWIQALAWCKVSGGHLAFPRSTRENRYMRNIANKRRARGNVWIGVNDIWREGRYRNTWNRIIRYRNWARREPNNYRGREDCVNLTRGLQWKDNHCNRRFPFICRKIYR